MSGELALRVAALEEQIATLIAGRPRRVYMSDVIRFQLPKVLPDLQRKNPNGVTVRHVMAHFGFPLATTQGALKELVDRGKIVRHRWPRENQTILLLPGQKPPDRQGMTRAQKKTLEGLIALCDEGRLEMSLNEMSRHLGVHAGTLLYNIDSLIAQGRVRRLTRGEGYRPSVYFIPSAIQ